MILPTHFPEMHYFYALSRHSAVSLARMIQNFEFNVADYAADGWNSSQGVEIHVAGWPPFWDKPEGMPWPHHVTAEAEKSACQFMAMEGACFVLVCTQILTEKSREKTKLMDSPFAKAPGGGFAMIFGPDGAPLVEPLDPGKEGILYAEIQLSTIDFAKQMIDKLFQDE
jgi:predicted amidohydrolase